MPARPSKNGRDAKAPIDAVNDAVAALTDLVRSLRASAKAVKSNAKASARELEADAKKAVRGAGPRAREVGRRITTGLGRAWKVLTEPEADSPAASAPGRKRRRAPRS